MGGRFQDQIWVKNQFRVNEMLKVFKRFVRSCDSFFYCKALIKTFLYVQRLNESQVCSLVNGFCPQHGLLMAFAIPTLNKVPVATTPSSTQHPLSLSAFSSCLATVVLTLSFWVRAATPLAWIIAINIGISPRGLPFPPAILIPRASLSS